MHENTAAYENTAALVAIDAALQTPSWCACDKVLDLAAHDGALWLECPTFSQPTRLPAAVSRFVRTALHERSFVLDLPEVATVVAATAPVVRAARSPKAAAAHA